MFCDARGGGGQGPLGLAHVGPAAQQLGPVAHRDRLGQPGRRAAGVGDGRQGLRRAAGEHRQLVEGRAALALQIGHDRLGLCQQRGLAGHVEVRQASGVALAPDDVVALLHHVHRLAGHGDLLAEGAGVGIGAGGFRRHGHAHEILSGGEGGGVGLGRLDGTAHTAEQIDLVGDVQPGGVGPLVRGLPAAQGGGEVFD